jgi:hypothetical protein
MIICAYRETACLTAPGSVCRRNALGPVAWPVSSIKPDKGQGVSKL